MRRGPPVQREAIVALLEQELRLGDIAGRLHITPTQLKHLLGKHGLRHYAKAKADHASRTFGALIGDRCFRDIRRADKLRLRVSR